MPSRNMLQSKRTLMVILCNLNFAWLLIFRERDSSMVFYSSTQFKKQQESSFTAHNDDDPHDDIFPDMRKSRFSSWPNEYNYDKVQFEPVPFIYNETGVLWEEKMGVDFLQDRWYEELEDIRTRIYNNITKYTITISITS